MAIIYSEYIANKKRRQRIFNNMQRQHAGYANVSAYDKPVIIDV